MLGTRARLLVAITAAAVVHGCSIFVTTDELDRGTSSTGSGAGGSPADGGVVTSAGGDGGATATTSGAGGDGGALDPSLVGAWSFDERTGSVAHDWTGHGHDAALTLTASFTADGQKGGALELHGGDFASVASLTGDVFPQSGTLSLWFRFSFDPADIEGRGLFDEYNPTRGHLFLRRAPNAPSGEFQVALQTAASQYAFAAGFDAIQGEWKHVVLTWDASSMNATLYIDGAVASSGSYEYPFAITYQDFKIGDGFEGAVDEMRLYDRPLPPAEASALP